MSLRLPCFLCWAAGRICTTNLASSLSSRVTFLKMAGRQDLISGARCRAVDSVKTSISTGEGLAVSW